MSRRGAILAEMGLAPLWRLRRQSPAEPEKQGLAGGGWVELKQLVSGCTKCGLHKTRTQTVFGVGDENADWMLIGEAPGAEEDRLGDPFVGQAGKLLDNMLAAIGLSRRANVYIANVLKCRPPGNRNPTPEEVAQCSPHLLQQIELIKPKLIVADEPVAMLDMSIRARILELLLALRNRYGLAYLFITHDLATAKFVCDRIAIMYLGRIVETGPTDLIFRDPKHPYTRALLSAIPVPEPGRVRERTLPRGEVPDAIFPPAGCRFHPRCPVALPTCGWEGRDFVDFLEQRRLDPAHAAPDESALGDLEEWRVAKFDARRRVREGDPAAVAAYVRSILPKATESLANAVVGVDVDGDHVVVRFREPDPLAPKLVEGRIVECLLY